MANEADPTLPQLTREARDTLEAVQGTVPGPQPSRVLATALVSVLTDQLQNDSVLTDILTRGKNEDQAALDRSQVLEALTGVQGLALQESRRTDTTADTRAIATEIAVQARDYRQQVADRSPLVDTFLHPILNGRTPKTSGLRRPLA